MTLPLATKKEGRPSCKEERVKQKASDTRNRAWKPLRTRDQEASTKIVAVKMQTTKRIVAASLKKKEKVVVVKEAAKTPERKRRRRREEVVKKRLKSIAMQAVWRSPVKKSRRSTTEMKARVAVAMTRKTMSTKTLFPF